MEIYLFIIVCLTALGMIVSSVKDFKKDAPLWELVLDVLLCIFVLIPCVYQGIKIFGGLE